MTELTWFAENGDYGSDEILLLRTDDWRPEHWERIDNCTDLDRFSEANKIDNELRAEQQQRYKKLQDTHLGLVHQILNKDQRSEYLDYEQDRANAYLCEQDENNLINTKTEGK
jgi:hypothetical protein